MGTSSPMPVKRYSYWSDRNASAARSDEDKVRSLSHPIRRLGSFQNPKRLDQDQFESMMQTIEKQRHMKPSSQRYNGYLNHQGGMAYVP